MSIIAKALKKAQEDRSKKQTKDDTVFTYTSSVPANPSPSIFSRIKIPKSVIVGALTVICVVVAVGVISKSLVSKDETIKSSRVISVPGAGNSADESSSRKQNCYGRICFYKETKGTGILENLPELNGIMYSAQDPQAIINDAVVLGER